MCSRENAGSLFQVQVLLLLYSFNAVCWQAAVGTTTAFLGSAP